MYYILRVDSTQILLESSLKHRFVADDGFQKSKTDNADHTGTENRQLFDLAHSH